MGKVSAGIWRLGATETDPERILQSDNFLRSFGAPLAVCAAMNYTTSIFKRRRHNKVEYIARLRYNDEENGARKEKSRSSPTVSEAKRLLRDIEDEFESGGQTAMESDHITFAELAKHRKDTRYCEAS